MPGFTRLRHPLVIAGIAFGLLGLVALVPAGEAAGAGLPFLRLSLALVGIVALALASAPYLRRLSLGSRREGSRLRCEELLALDARHRLALVSVDGRALLLGLQADGCVLLKDLGENAGSREAEPIDLEFPSSQKLRALLAKQPER